MGAPTRFYAVVLSISVAGGLFGWFVIRKDLVGVLVGIGVMCAPAMVLAAVIGVHQLRREARK